MGELERFVFKVKKAAARACHPFPGGDIAERWQNGGFAAVFVASKLAGLPLLGHMAGKGQR